MPVDTSIYQNRTPPDLIPGGLGGTVGLANALTQNQILNAQNQQAQGALRGQGQLGAALTAAGGDPTIAQNALSGPGGNIDPLYASRAYQELATLRGTQGTATTIASQGAQERAANFYARLNALGATGTAGTQDYAGLINEGLHTNAITPTEGTAILSGLPRDPKAQAAFIADRTAGFVTAPQQSAPAQVGVVPGTLQPISGTEAQRQAHARAPGGTVTTAPFGGPEQIAASENALTADKQTTAPGLLRANRPIANAIDALGKLSNTDFGKTSDDIASVNSFLQTVGVIPSGQQITNANELRQVANKYLHQIASAAVASGVHSDAGLAQVNSSNASLDLTQAAGLHLLKNQYGLNLQDAMMPAAYELEHPNHDIKYSDYSGQYLKNTDYRALMLEKQSPEERNATFNSFLPLGSKTRFTPNMTPEQFAAANDIVKKANTPAYQKFVRTYQLAKATNSLGTTPEPTPAEAQ